MRNMRMPQCRDAPHDECAFADGLLGFEDPTLRLGAASITRLERHVTECADCAAAHADALQLISDLRDSPALAPPRPPRVRNQLSLQRVAAAAALLVVVATATLLPRRAAESAGAGQAADRPAAVAPPVAQPHPTSWRDIYPAAWRRPTLEHVDTVVVFDHHSIHGRVRPLTRIRTTAVPTRLRRRED